MNIVLLITTSPIERTRVRRRTIRARERTHLEMARTIAFVLDLFARVPFSIRAVTHSSTKPAGTLAIVIHERMKNVVNVAVSAVCPVLTLNLSKLVCSGIVRRTPFWRGTLNFGDEIA